MNVERLIDKKVIKIEIDVLSFDVMIVDKGPGSGGAPNPKEKKKTPRSGGEPEGRVVVIS